VPLTRWEFLSEDIQAKLLEENYFKEPSIGRGQGGGVELPTMRLRMTHADAPAGIS